MTLFSADIRRYCPDNFTPIKVSAPLIKFYSHILLYSVYSLFAREHWSVKSEAANTSYCGRMETERERISLTRLPKWSLKVHIIAVFAGVYSVHVSRT